MTHRFIHDQLFRGEEAFQKLATPRITICGAGAIGSQMVDNLARQGFRNLRVIDFDRVEQHNVNTQIYGIGDVGALKVDVLKNQLFRSLELEIDVVAKKLESRSVKKQLAGSHVVIDAFDNSASRQLVQDHCRQTQLPCLHVGLSADYCEIIWDEVYRVPKDADEDVCDYPLARNIVLLSVAIATETVIRFVLSGERASHTCTLGDFCVQRFNG